MYQQLKNTTANYINYLPEKTTACPVQKPDAIHYSIRKISNPLFVSPGVTLIPADIPEEGWAHVPAK